MTEIHEQIYLDELNCTVCQNPYGDGAQNPRILSCGHTFCTGCIKSLLHSRPHCPECRVPIVYKDVKYIPIAYIVKKILESINELNKLHIEKNSSTIEKIDGNNGKKCPSTIYEDIPALEAVGVCPVHDAPQQFWCERCTLWICGSCAFLDHCNNHTENTCVIFLATQQFEKIKRKEFSRLTTQYEEICNAKSTTQNFIELIHHSINDISQCKVLDKPYSKIIRNLDAKVEFLTKSSNIVDETKQVLNVNTIKQMKDASDSIEEFFISYGYPKSEEELVEGVWNEIFCNIPTVISCAKFLVTSVVREGIRYFSNMYVKGNTLVIPQFHATPVKTHYLIPYSEVKSCASSMKAYLKLGIHGEMLGTVQISLFNNKRAEQFAMLCTGENGPSYKMTKFFSSKGLFTRYIMGGDYENNDGTGGKAIIEITNDVEQRQMQDGFVCGEHNTDNLAQFKIYYEAGSSPYARYCIGFIEYGLDLIKEIGKEKYNETYIEDCGVLIPFFKDDDTFCYV